jgi:hypothetical protein
MGVLPEVKDSILGLAYFVQRIQKAMKASIPKSTLIIGII